MEQSETKPVSRVVFHDNRRVKTTKWGGEFLAVVLQTTDEFHQDECYLHRYCLPGRIDSYCFGYAPAECSGFAPAVRYCTEGSETLLKALLQVQIDLDKPQAVEMLVGLCGIHASRSLCENLIAVIAPKSKALRAMRKAIAKVKAANKQAYNHRHPKSLNP